MYEITFSKQARKAYIKLPPKQRDLIHNKLEQLAGDPYSPNNNIKQLKGLEHCYRLRVGDWRIIYHINDNSVTIEIIKLGHRKEVYQ